MAHAATRQRLITYAQLADTAGISGKHRINRLTTWLEARLEASCAIAIRYCRRG